MTINTVTWVHCTNLVAMAMAEAYAKTLGPNDSAFLASIPDLYGNLSIEQFGFARLVMRSIREYFDFWHGGNVLRFALGYFHPDCMSAMIYHYLWCLLRKQDRAIPVTGQCKKTCTCCATFRAHMRTDNIPVEKPHVTTP
jgi:hypothetical protein